MSMRELLNMVKDYWGMLVSMAVASWAVWLRIQDKRKVKAETVSLEIKNVDAHIKHLNDIIATLEKENNDKDKKIIELMAQDQEKSNIINDFSRKLIAVQEMLTKLQSEYANVCAQLKLSK